MKVSWKTSHAPDARLNSAPSPAGVERGDTRNIRGRISGPIPIASSIDSETLPDHPMPRDVGLARTLTPPLLVEDDGKTPTPTPERINMPSTPPSSISRHVQIAHDSNPSSRASNAFRDTAPPRSAAHYVNHSESNMRTSITSAGTAETYEDRPQRSKSMLRGAIGRLFGRRKKSVSQITSMRGSTRPVTEASSPPHRRSKSEAVQSTTGQKGLINRERPSSVPLQELNGEPVRSNSTGTDNRRPGDGTRASYASGRNFSRGRNSASPFRALETRQGEPAGLTPRPASSSGRINKVQTPVDDPEEIGRAITMDSTGLKRRSRSLSVLFDNDGGANEKLGVENEIRYWRKSYESVNASQVSSVPPDTPGNGNDLETVEETGMDVEAPGPETVQQPAPMFDMSAIKELAGMKITQVANTQTTMLDIERRLAQLEQEVADLSHSQHHLDPGHRQSNEDGSLDRKKRVRRTSPRDLSVDSQRPSRLQNRTLPLRDSDSSSIWYANGQAAAPASGENSASVSRPLSNATIRGVSTRPPSLTRDMNGPFTMDHYATLLALLQTERSAREALEDQVKGLNHQVQSMSRTMEEARLQQGGKTSKLSHLSVFDDYGDDSGDEQDGDRHGDNDGHRTSSAAATATTTRATDKRARPSESTVSSHAVTHSEVEADSSISTFEDDEDSASYYATPYEEDASSGGEERHRDAVKSDRTMSLSQLTMRSPGKMDHDPMPQDGWPRVFV